MMGFLELTGAHLKFQTQTGFPGHLADIRQGKKKAYHLFQTQTGFPGHLACCPSSIA